LNHLLRGAFARGTEAAAINEFDAVHTSSSAGVTDRRGEVLHKFTPVDTRTIRSRHRNSKLPVDNGNRADAVRDDGALPRT
jgi:hypothetical protein